MIDHRGATQGMQIAIRVEAQLRGAMVAEGQFLAGIAEGLEVADGVGMVQQGDEWRSLLPLWLAKQPDGREKTAPCSRLC